MVVAVPCANISKAFFYLSKKSNQIHYTLLLEKYTCTYLNSKSFLNLAKVWIVHSRCAHIHLIRIWSIHNSWSRREGRRGEYWNASFFGKDLNPHFFFLWKRQFNSSWQTYFWMPVNFFLQNLCMSSIFNVECQELIKKLITVL